MRTCRATDVKDPVFVSDRTRWVIEARVGKSYMTFYSYSPTDALRLANELRSGVIQVGIGEGPDESNTLVDLREEV